MQPPLLAVYDTSVQAIRTHLVRHGGPSVCDNCTFVGQLNYRTGIFQPQMDHLVCFVPGMLALGASGVRLIHAYAYTYTHIHILYIHTYTYYTYIHACSRGIRGEAYRCIHIHVYAYTCIHMHTHAYTCIHMHTHAYTCIHMHARAYTCTHTHTYPAGDCR